MHYREQVARMHEKRASELFRHSDKPAAFTSEYFSSTPALRGRVAFVLSPICAAQFE